MPAYKFTWNFFDEKFLKALAAKTGKNSELSPADAVKSVRIRPDYDFVKQNKELIIDLWLKNPETGGKLVKSITDQLIEWKLGNTNITPKSFSEQINFISDCCRRSKRAVNLLLKGMIKFGERSSVNEPISANPLVKAFSVLKVKEQPIDSRKPFSYQDEIWVELDAELRKQGEKFAGILVMPTGSGKTFTAVRWLMKNALDNNMKILWIAHRHELLEQAAQTFCSASAFVKREQLRIRIVSSIHCPPNIINEADDIIISMPYLLKDAGAENVLKSGKFFLVVDEAHHTPAESYKKIFNLFKEKPSYHILGLTATPTRTSEKERPALARLFNDNLFQYTNTEKLREAGYLANPKPVIVHTSYHIDTGLTDKDIELMKSKNIMSAEWMDKIAKDADRNYTIYSHYKKNRTEYGKTLVFAVNIRHADLLKHIFNSEGEISEYVASYRHDDVNDSRSDIISRFKDPNSGLDVLINVEMLTEGVDIPAVKTVLLTRPTKSETLFRQMIGRALRGKKTGGTDIAYLVSFEDHWEIFKDWENPFQLVPDVIVPTEEIKKKTNEKPEIQRSEIEAVESLPWEMIREVTVNLRRNLEYAADIFEAVPDGWYILETEGNDEEDEPTRDIIHIYKHQRICWEKMIDHLLQYKTHLTDNQKLADEMTRLFFSDCDIPQPSSGNIGKMISYILSTDNIPEYAEFNERRNSDPYEIAKAIAESNLGNKEKNDLISERYKESLAKAVYPTLREFSSAVDDAIFEIAHPEESTRKLHGEPIFDETEFRPMAKGNHDLQILLDRVLKKGSEFLGENLPNSVTIHWTDRYIKGYSGICYQGEKVGQGRIKINKLLNSSDISETALEFLIWHEYLHAYLPFEKHSKRFRELERKWPNYDAGGQELDSIGEKYSVSYW